MESKIIVSMDDDTKDWKENQPCISSSDPNERKLARRLRIRKRLKNAEKYKFCFYLIFVLYFSVFFFVLL